MAKSPHFMHEKDGVDRIKKLLEDYVERLLIRFLYSSNKYLKKRKIRVRVRGINWNLD